MGFLLKLLLFGSVTVVVVGLTATLVLWRVLRTRLRVHPEMASAAPLHWNIPRGEAAKAHRRLRLASQTALRVSAMSSAASSAALQPLGESIARQGIEVERDLVNAARTHRSVRSQALAQPILAVGRIEATLAQLQATSAQWQRAIDGPASPDLLDEVQDQLAAMQKASTDVRRVDTPPERVQMDG
jgi:hypothetical protein